MVARVGLPFRPSAPSPFRPCSPTKCSAAAPSELGLQSLSYLALTWCRAMAEEVRLSEAEASMALDLLEGEAADLAAQAALEAERQQEEEDDDEDEEEEGDEDCNEEEAAAMLLQRCWRGYVGRRAAWALQEEQYLQVSAGEREKARSDKEQLFSFSLSLLLLSFLFLSPPFGPMNALAETTRETFTVVPGQQLNEAGVVCFAAAR